jgi:hypothetical protein
MRIDGEMVVDVVVEVKFQQLMLSAHTQQAEDSRKLTQAEESKLERISQEIITLRSRFLWNFQALPDTIVKAEGLTWTGSALLRILRLNLDSWQMCFYLCNNQSKTVN